MMSQLASDTAQLIISRGLPLLVPIVGSIALFGFLAVASWADARRQEREAFFRHELLKKLAESDAASAQRVMDLIRQEESERLERQRDGLWLGGWIVVAVGVGLSLLLSQVAQGRGLWAVGAIPTLVGVALLAHASNLARRAKQSR